jgi:hypothetical protein
MSATEPGPALRILSLGAGVQSTALLMLAAEGTIPTFDAAIFADTGWEPKRVYDHLDRIEAEIAQPAGIPIYRVTAGNIRDDALDPAHRFASMPLYVLNKDGSPGMGRRQCTSEYKLKPIKRKVRELLGYVHPTPVPRGVYAEQAIGISADETHRANVSDVQYARNVWPLLELGWTRKRCIAYLEARGWGATPKSACVGCPFHGNRTWRTMRDTAPAEFADAVAFDAAIRAEASQAGDRGQGLRTQMFLHRSRLPLDQAPIDRVTPHEWNDRQITVDDLLDQAAFEDAYSEDDIPGCSPFACRSDALGSVAP